jgi:tetratricopeptide (TPR) repeat protein
LAGRLRSIEQRVARQSVEGRTLLGLLALLGREAPTRLLAASSGSALAEVSSRLDALTIAGLTRLGDEGWALDHDLIGTTIIGELGHEQRGLLHQSLASALAESGAEPAELAIHLAGAGDLDAAVDAYVTAAGRSLRRLAHPEAQRLTEAGFELSPKGGRRAALLEIRAELRARADDLDGARHDLRSALADLVQPEARSRILARLAILSVGAEDPKRASELVTLAIAEAGDVPAARAEALAAGTIVDMNLDRPDRARSRSVEAQRLFEEIGDARGVAEVLDARAMATFLDGNLPRALDEFERVTGLFQDLGDLLRMVTPISTGGHGLLFAARPAEALEQTGRALDLARSLGNLDGLAMVLWHHSETLSASGDGDDALEHAREAVSAARSLRHRGWTATAHLALGVARETRGEPDEAEAAYRRSLEGGDPFPLFATWAAARLARLLIGQGRLDEGTRYVAEATREGPALGQYEARLAQAELAVARGDDDAPGIVAEALEQAQAGGHVLSAHRLEQLASGKQRDLQGDRALPE